MSEAAFRTGSAYIGTATIDHRRQKIFFRHRPARKRRIRRAHQGRAPRDRRKLRRCGDRQGQRFRRIRLRSFSSRRRRHRPGVQRRQDVPGEMMRHLITIADDYKTGRTGPVRVKRDQRPSAVVGVSADTLPAARRLRVVYGVYWFGNFTGGGDRAANLNLSAEHEASGNADIVNRRGSDRGIHRNGMASVNRGGKIWTSQVDRRRRENWSEVLMDRESHGHPACAIPATLRWPGGGKNRPLFDFSCGTTSRRKHTK